MRVQDVPQISYLNTDLELVSPASVAPLVAHLECAGVFTLSQTRPDGHDWHVTFEAEASFEEPDPNIRGLLEAIESATGAARQCWDACTSREFNVGYDCGEEPWAFSQGLANETLRRMADCGATLRFTLYPLRLGT